MDQNGRNPGVLRFGAFELDPALGELRKGGAPVKLKSQQFQLLALLAGRAGRIVSREEIRLVLWDHETFVDFDQSINVCVNKTRDALQDDPRNPRYIETLPRKGYRFIAPIIQSGNGVAQAPLAVGVAASVLPWRKYAVPIGVAAIVILAGAVFLELRTPPQRFTNRDTLVLADLTNLTGDPVFDGTLREALAFQLEQSPFLKVLDDEVMRQDHLVLIRGFSVLPGQRRSGLAIGGF
jgi:DNA-binding winged helix-turn-helix (wHTH) protein